MCLYTPSLRRYATDDRNVYYCTSRDGKGRFIRSHLPPEQKAVPEDWRVLEFAPRDGPVRRVKRYAQALSVRTEPEAGDEAGKEAGKEAGAGSGAGSGSGAQSEKAGAEIKEKIEGWMEKTEKDATQPASEKDVANSKKEKSSKGAVSEKTGDHGSVQPGRSGSMNTRLQDAKGNHDNKSEPTKPEVVIVTVYEDGKQQKREQKAAERAALKQQFTWL